MKEIKKNQEIMPKEIKVRPYLTYAEIEKIAEEVCRFDTWSERETTIDLLIMHYLTDMPDKDVEEIGHETLVASGTMDGIREQVKNFSKVYEAINYNESVQRALAMIAKEMPDLIKPLKEATQNARSKK